MIRPPPRAPVRQKTLLSVLRRAHLSLVVAAISLVGLSLMTTGTIILMAYANDSLRLVAHAIAYNAQAATVFEDHAAALDALASIATTEDIASATITDRHGEILARWDSPPHGLFAMLAHYSARLLQQRSVSTPIIHDEAIIGMVTVSGNGQNLLSYIISGILGIILSEGLIVASAVLVSRRMMDEIVGPLQNFTRVAHAVREDRDFDRRVPGAAITELNSFASDFNALLDELAIWQSHVATETASLQYRASHDSLTGLCNRAVFEDRLLQEIDHANLRGAQIALLLIDCDRFKEINDRYGHAAGDAVLVCISERLRDQLSTGDVAARLGGDEFALLVTSGHHIADARRVVDAIRASMQTPITLPGGERIVASLSIGIAMYPDHAGDVSQLMHLADLAMYRSKFIARQKASKPTTEGE